MQFKQLGDAKEKKVRCRFIVYHVAILLVDEKFYAKRKCASIVLKRVAAHR